MKVDKVVIPPVPVEPEVKVVLELSHKEALDLMWLIGTLAVSETAVTTYVAKSDSKRVTQVYENKLVYRLYDSLFSVLGKDKR